MDVSISPSRHPGLALLQASDLFYPCVDDPYIQGNPIFYSCQSKSQSTNDWYRGPTELVHNFAYKGSSLRCKGAARQIIDMVWLYRSPFPVMRREVFLLVHWMISTCLRGSYRNRVVGFSTWWSVQRVVNPHCFHEKNVSGSGWLSIRIRSGFSFFTLKSSTSSPACN